MFERSGGGGILRKPNGQLRLGDLTCCQSQENEAGFFLACGYGISVVFEEYKRDLHCPYRQSSRAFDSPSFMTASNCEFFLMKISEKALS